MITFNRFWESSQLEKKKSKSNKVLPPDNLSEEEIRESFSKLSQVEINQFGKKNCISKEDWPRFRKMLVQNSQKRVQGLNPSMTAYTPAETFHLLHNPIVMDWHSKVINHNIPDGYDTLIFVPCAATKPWGVNTCKRSKPYTGYHMVRKEYGNVYFVTISEPLGIVPQDMWETFPIYDCPGLFKCSAQRNSMETKDWIHLYPEKNLKSRMVTPFDEQKYEECIDILGGVVDSFIKNVMSKKPNLKVLSFVDDKEGKDSTTHSHMLNKINKEILSAIKRYPKNSRNDNPEQRKDYIIGKINQN